MESRFAAENINNKDGEIEDEFDSYRDDKVRIYETAISREYIKQEPSDTEDEPGNINNYIDIKDDKVCVYETVIWGGYLKQDPYNTTHQPRNTDNYATIKEEIIEDSTVVKHETGCLTRIKENYRPCCQGCGKEYDLYCLECPMLMRIFDGNNPDLSDNGFMRTLPTNFVDTSKTQSGMAIVALRVIPKGVAFGPIGGLDLTKDDALSKWASRNKELVYAEDLKSLNWMEYIRRVDQCAHSNLKPFQYEDGLYYQSDCHINVGDELLVCWNSDREESATLDSCFKPRICESLDDVYACTLCCVGYKSMCHLAAHNSRCPRKRNQNDFCKEIIQCAFCKIYLDEKEYSNYHMDRCCKRNRKIFAMHQTKKQDERKKDVKRFACIQCTYKTKTKQQLNHHIITHNDDKPFACTQCPFKTKTDLRLKRHLINHNGDKPIACSLCSYKTKTNWLLKQHMSIHSDHKPFECSLCPFKTATSSRLKEHMVIHYDDKPFGCKQCSFRTKTSRLLRRHLVIHSNDTPFACSICSFKTRTSIKLKRHIVSHNDDNQLFACPICLLKTKTQEQLTYHMLSHNDDKLVECTYCPYKTTNNWSLKQHIVKHNDDKPFACPLCSYKTTRNSTLKQHMVTHSDDKPFRCSVCSYKTKLNSNLRKHITTHNGDKPFTCSLCAFKSKVKYKLNQHIALHKNDKRINLPFVNEEKSLTESKD